MIIVVQVLVQTERQKDFLFDVLRIKELSKTEQTR